MAKIHLSVRNLDKHYGLVYALKKLNLDIYSGEIVGLIGDNGAGKSTFIKILSGIHSQTSGDIFFEGKKIRLSNPREAMELGIETIYQYTAMVPEMSIIRNIFMRREKLKWGFQGLGFLDMKAMEEVALKIISDIGLHLNSVNVPVKELSGGQRQGIAIARAMYFHSRMLILDEPTNHLSVKETNRVLDYFRDLKKRGITVIFISHNLHHIKAVSDRIIAIARGAKVADLKTDEVEVNQMIELIT